MPQAMKIIEPTIRRERHEQTKTIQSQNEPFRLIKSTQIVIRYDKHVKFDENWQNRRNLNISPKNVTSNENH